MIAPTQSSGRVRCRKVVSRAVWAFVSCMLFSIVACAPGLPESATGPKRAPPPKPGSSITHTKMCTCTACPVARCCRGETAADSETSSCTDSTDFSSEACTLSIGSCVGRCYDCVWRVSLGDDCTDKQPDECC